MTRGHNFKVRGTKFKGNVQGRVVFTESGGSGGSYNSAI